MTKEKLLTKNEIGVYEFFSDKPQPKNYYDIRLGDWMWTVKIENDETALKLNEDIQNNFEGKTKEYAIEHLQEVLNKFSLSLN